MQHFIHKKKMQHFHYTKEKRNAALFLFHSYLVEVFDHS